MPHCVSEEQNVSYTQRVKPASVTLNKQILHFLLEYTDLELLGAQRGHSWKRQINCIN